LALGATGTYSCKGEELVTWTYRLVMLVQGGFAGYCWYKIWNQTDAWTTWVGAIINTLIVIYGVWSYFQPPQDTNDQFLD